MKRSILLSLAMLSLAPAAFATGTLAADVDGVPTRVVRVHDLDLDRPQGVGILYQRLRNAVADVCPVMSREPQRRERALACRRDTLQRTVDGAGIPELTALHQQKTGQEASRLAHR